MVTPTYNGERYLKHSLPILEKYMIDKDYDFVIIDSSSTDKTKELLRKYDLNIITISKKSFNHGSTRNLGAKLAKGNILVFLTQDAIPTSNSIENIIKPLIESREVGLAYGRQIPHKDANFYSAFARYFNYPNENSLKSIKDVPYLGIKSIFVSNSFAAYKKDVLFEIGGFPSNVILGEDTYVAAKILKKGYKISYVADAIVYHSHNYSIWQEFKRYFDTGVFHNREKWLLNEFAKAEREGIRYVKSEIAYAFKQKKSYLLPNIIFRNGVRFLGYKLGRMENYIPNFLKSKLSMHKDYWNQT
ncbi:glycosyltransferase [Geobacillus sp. FSL K6-0789]|uniref:glycosyltransferase family 2 protein n=1 Tax=Geobacillus sp. FSL K6-0789 TaxID=2954744 RepID=UPI0031585094